MTRREFIVGAGAVAFAGCRHPFCGGSGIRLAMAGYTLNKFESLI